MLMRNPCFNGAVQDDKGETSVVTRTLTVLNVAPTINRLTRNITIKEAIASILLLEPPIRVSMIFSPTIGTWIITVSMITALALGADFLCG
jgi:hypothetical protein